MNYYRFMTISLSITTPVQLLAVGKQPATTRFSKKLVLRFALLQK